MKSVKLLEVKQMIYNQKWIQDWINQNLIKIKLDKKLKQIWF